MRRKIGDWRLSQRLLDDSQNRGLTLSYAAPEQLDSDTYGDPDDYTDIYQLGVVTYEALTGRVPFDEGEQSATVQAILSEMPVPPSEVTTGIPPALDEVVLQALAKHKEERYESVLYFRDDLIDAIE